MTPRPPLSVELALPSLAIGGMEVIAVQLARALAARGHSVGVTYTEETGPLVEVLEADGIHTTLVQASGLTPNLFVGRLRRWFEARRPDVVHIQSEPWVKVARAARKAGVACVGMTQHGVITPEPWHVVRLRRWAIHSTDWVATVSQPLLTYLVGTSTDTPPIYRDLDAFVLSSLTEGTSMSLLEAMASGVPVVATAVGGNVDVLDQGQCGLLVPPRQPALLADALHRLLADRAQRERLARDGRARVVAHYSESAMVAHYEDLYYASLTAGGRP